MLLIKWSKTLQEKQGWLIQLSTIPTSPLCPILALLRYIAIYPSQLNQPFFTLPGSATPIITQTMARQSLDKVLWGLNLNPCHYSFHTFRHSCRCNTVFCISAVAKNQNRLQNQRLHLRSLYFFPTNFPTTFVFGTKF